MVRDSGISATRPIFPSYLLPSFKFPLSRRRSSPSSNSSSSCGEASLSSSAATTPDNSPPHHAPITKHTSGRWLSRTAPNTIRCSNCSTDIAFTSQIISKGFTGRYGRAFLVTPPPAPVEQTLLNIREGHSENRQLATGWHVVADIRCGTCSRKIGWKYVDAKEQTQKYKVGKYILEVERTSIYTTWSDVAEEDAHASDEADDNSRRSSADVDDIVFDSDDDEECEDIFAGTWDAEEVAKRRSQMVGRRQSLAE